MRAGEIMGIGYEGATVERVVDDLVAAGVTTLVDVRLTPLSRKPGLSKRALSQHLNSAGIEYVHLPELGNPKWNRPGFAADGAERAVAHDNYRETLCGPAAREALSRLRGLVATQAVAVLCFEADGARCHRSLVIDEARRPFTDH
jgi:uncharacterized protein (DUF488 family)